MDKIKVSKSPGFEPNKTITAFAPAGMEVDARNIIANILGAKKYYSMLESAGDDKQTPLTRDQALKRLDSLREQSLVFEKEYEQLYYLIKVIFNEENWD